MADAAYEADEADVFAQTLETGRKEGNGWTRTKKKTSDYKGYFTRTKPESNATLMHRHNNSKELTIRADDQ